MSDTADQTAEPPDPQETDGGQAALETRARNMGWRPREEFRGDAERWLPAEEFVDRGERLLPLLQERSRAADRTITELREQVALQGTTLQEMLASTRKAEQVGYRRAMQELHQQRTRAVEMGDTAAFQAVEQAMRELGPPPADPQQTPQRPPQAPQPNTDPVIHSWVQRNPWFRNDPVANVAMIAAMQQAERERPSDGVEQHLVLAEDVMRRHFPEHFPRPLNGSGNGAARRPMHVEAEVEEEPVQPPRRQTSPVSRSSADPAPRRVAARSFEAIPREVQSQYERQRKMLEGKGDPFTREEFARYYWENETE